MATRMTSYEIRLAGYKLRAFARTRLADNGKSKKFTLALRNGNKAEITLRCNSLAGSLSIRFPIHKGRVLNLLRAYNHELGGWKFIKEGY